MILRRNDLKLLTKLRIENIFMYIRNRLSRNEEDSQTDYEKEKIKRITW